ncbi:Type I phosphatidylinositol 4,5-bisphosphate 4-phosphatase-B [Anabarilius grahami]|uniref:Phosphatidylinositol-4,5-bisphosphate 4-phosphatase n=1 Tax=Anabarilius grahami TaxID=495550 RepID=A0A3N0YH88_ANAGA|nr:Type I phosphatidylinositol 4,5-bisphosphate 4-phosphatase-B [Anabarilius grahami]
MADGERSPLLSDSRDGMNGLSPVDETYRPPTKPQNFPSAPPLSMLGEAPPPYSPLGSPESGSAPVISCRVCQSLISVEGKIHQHVVKCGVCNEATAGTWLNARQYKGIYASWVFFILLVLFTLFRALHWACMKISEPLQNYS